MIKTFPVVKMSILFDRVTSFKKYDEMFKQKIVGGNAFGRSSRNHLWSFEIYRAMGVAAMLRTNASSDCLHSCSAGVIRIIVPLPPPPPLDGLGTCVTGLELIVW